MSLSSAAWNSPGLHVVGVAAKAGVAPAAVGRVLAGMPQSAQRLHGYIFDVLCRERGSQRGVVELRVVTRTGIVLMSARRSMP